jgi:hypothetical protein
MEYFSFRILVLLKVFHVHVWKGFQLQAPSIESHPLAHWVDIMLQTLLKLSVTHLQFCHFHLSQIEIHRIIIPQLQFHQLRVHCVQMYQPHLQFHQVTPHPHLCMFKVLWVEVQWLLRTCKHWC